MASPFHSEIIQEEVALRLSRPATLDRDARALGQTPREQDAARLEPAYEGVRVARIEAEGRDLELTALQGTPRALHPALYRPGEETAEPHERECWLRSKTVSLEGYPVSSRGTIIYLNSLRCLPQRLPRWLLLAITGGSGEADTCGAKSFCFCFVVKCGADGGGSVPALAHGRPYR